MSAARPEENAAAEALPDDEGPSSEDMVVSPPSAPTETSAAREDEDLQGPAGQARSGNRKRWRRR